MDISPQVVKSIRQHISLAWMLLGGLIVLFSVLLLFNASFLWISNSVILLGLGIFQVLHAYWLHQKIPHRSQQEYYPEIMVELQRKRALDLFLVCVGLVIGVLSIFFPLNMEVAGVYLAGCSALVLILTLKLEWELGLLEDKLDR